MEEERDKATLAEQLARTTTRTRLPATRERAPLQRVGLTFLVGDYVRILVDAYTADCLRDRRCIMLSLRAGVGARGRGTFRPFLYKPWRWYLVPWWWRWTVSLGYALVGDFMAHRSEVGQTWREWPSQIPPK